MTTRVFRSGNSLAVRLPREIAFEEGAEVSVTLEAGRLVISRARMDMRTLVDRLAQPPRPRPVERLELKSPRRLWPEA